MLQIVMQSVALVIYPPGHGSCQMIFIKCFVFNECKKKPNLAKHYRMGLKLGLVFTQQIF